MTSYLVMGQSYSKEVKSFRKKSKKEANALGFLPNKRAVAHPLNRAPESTKDPRSKRQAETWEAEVNFRLIHRPFDPSRMAACLLWWTSWRPGGSAKKPCMILG